MRETLRGGQIASSRLKTFGLLGPRHERFLGDSEELSKLIRGITIEMSGLKSTSHLGSNLSCIDILSVTSEVLDENNEASIDLVLSKGHAALALYALLFMRGLIDETLLMTFGDRGSKLEEHPNHEIPGVVFPTGSLGHGLGLLAGRLIGSRIIGAEKAGIAILSDGECNEGTVWEAALFAAAKRVGKLVAVIDANGFQATGPTKESFGTVKISEMFTGFGWEGESVDGHDHLQLKQAILRGLRSSGPYFVVASTIKGKGVSFMEGDNNWHYRVPNEDEVLSSLKELGIVSSK